MTLSSSSIFPVDSQTEFALNFHKIYPLAFRIGSPDFEDLVKRSALKTAAGHGEIDERNSTADVRGELDRRISCGKEHGEGRREIYVLINQPYKDTTANSLDFPVQDGVQNGIEMFNVLNQ